MKVRLSKALSEAGIASRRKAEEMIFAGRVAVNGAIVTLPQEKVDPQSDRIAVDEAKIISTPPLLYYALNKPIGYVCSHRRLRKERLVYDLFDTATRLFSLGRLDKNTSGLLLITNDGQFAQKVIHPSADMEKEYLATTSLQVSKEHLDALRLGTEIEGKWITPSSVQIKGKAISIAVKEGKKHEVRLLMQAAKLPVQSLMRVRIGPLHLGHLRPGTFRTLTEKERSQIYAHHC